MNNKAPFRAYQNDVIKNVTVLMSAVLKRVDCSVCILFRTPAHHISLY